MRRVGRTTFFLLLAAASLFASAPARAQSGPSCGVLASSDWTEPEKWAWREICSGRAANFNRRYNKKPDPRKADGWDTTRSIRTSFLRTILVREPFRSAITRIGVQFIGAWFTETIELNHVDVRRVLAFGDSRFERGVSFGGAKFHRTLSFAGSTVFLTLDLNGARIQGNLFLRRNAEFGSINLRGAQIDSQLSMNGASVRASVDMNNMVVGKSLFASDGSIIGNLWLMDAKIGGLLQLNGTTIRGRVEMARIRVGDGLFMNRSTTVKGQVNLLAARIDGTVSFSSAMIQGKLNLNSIRIGGSLLMRDNGSFQNVDLTGAEIGSQVSMRNSTVRWHLDMSSINVGKSVFLDKKSILTLVSLINAKIGGSLDITDSSIWRVDLTGATIGGELRLGSAHQTATRWWKYEIPQEKGARRQRILPSTLVLRNLTVASMQDRRDAWPEQLVLDGFSYKLLGGFSGRGEDADMARRDKDWFIAWLEKDKDFSPQPYEQLARVLRAAGQNYKADEILFASQKREMREEWQRGEYRGWAWSAAKRIFIGFGYRTYYTLYWAVGLVIVGALIFRSSREARERRYPIGLSYSLDMLLPIVKLRESHYTFDLNSPLPRYYFYFHKTMGYVLVSFLFAGLSGLPL